MAMVEACRLSLVPISRHGSAVLWPLLLIWTELVAGIMVRYQASHQHGQLEQGAPPTLASELLRLRTEAESDLSEIAVKRLEYTASSN